MNKYKYKYSDEIRQQAILYRKTHTIKDTCLQFNVSQCVLNNWIHPNTYEINKEKCRLWHKHNPRKKSQGKHISTKLPYTKELKKEILDYLEQHTQIETMNKYGVSRTTLRLWTDVNYKNKCSDWQRQYFMRKLKKNLWKHSTKQNWRDQPEYYQWKTNIRKRDNMTCQKCLKHGNHVHHIKSASEYPDLRLDINNGITLCETCHKKEHLII